MVAERLWLDAPDGVRTLRLIALADVACAIITFACGLSTGRRVLRDTSGCERAQLVHAWFEIGKSVVNPFEAINPVTRGARWTDQPREGQPTCTPQIELVERPALAAEGCAALAAIAVAGALAALWPRRTMAGAWIIVAGVAGVIAFVLTPTFDVRVELTDHTLTWYAARVAIVALAAALVGAVRWLVWASGRD